MSQPPLFPELPEPPRTEWRTVEVKEHTRRVKEGRRPAKPSEARARKEQGQKLAAGKAGDEWFARMLVVLPVWLQSGGSMEFTFEDFRSWCEQQKEPAPASLNAWGALPRIACKAGLCAATGRYVRATRPESHSRAIAVWRPLV